MIRFVVILLESLRRRGRTRVATPLALIVCLVSSGRVMTAQEAPATVPSHTLTPAASVRPRLVDVQHRPLAVEEYQGIAQPAQRGSSRDTLKNGAIIGAIGGAVGLGAMGALICHLYQEEGGASCWPDTLRGAAIGAAIGTGAGVTVDAVLTRQAGVAVHIGVKF